MGKNKKILPERTPDVIFVWKGEEYSIWFDKMLLYDSLYVSLERIIFDDNVIQMYDQEYGESERYVEDFETTITSVYKKWLISKSLKEKLNERKTLRKNRKTKERRNNDGFSPRKKR